MRVLETLQVIWRGYDHIHRDPDSVEVSPYLSAETSAIGSFFHDENVNVAVRSHISTSGGPEQDDPFRLGDLYDTLNNVVQRLLVKRLGPHRLLIPSQLSRTCGYVSGMACVQCPCFQFSISVPKS